MGESDVAVADLRDRIRAGEFAAFEDPSLALHLLAEPDAVWWWEGVEKVACALQKQLIHDSQAPVDATMQTPENLRKMALCHLNGVGALATGLDKWPEDVVRMLPLIERWLPSRGHGR